MAAYDIVRDAETMSRAWGQTLDLAQMHRLFTYNAAHLSLAFFGLCFMAIYPFRLIINLLGDGVDCLIDINRRASESEEAAHGASGTNPSI